ncbi:ABC transporter substrate-binding protein [Actinomadura flavalba]|uniref:ABC transporter substrate-binding protein n=1 Tax=Actinomadura flavalba TaxID=1120938 RepID=UPI001969AC04|nr:ABC transporter substrate-binding protein [Actinomadura flavalba]
MRMRRSLPAAAAIALIAAAAGPVAPAHAIDPGKGHPGFCKTAAGVTVVVDFQRLGGTTIVRCNPRRTRGTGLDALKGAGFQIAGVQRWGEGFICRIENRPSAVEELPVRGRDGYREACVDTPPGGAYWSYWHAGNNCAWQYSQWGVKNRDFVPGGFEGWSFSLNATAASNPRPRIAAVRPGTAGRPCVAREEPEPTTNDPNERQPGGRAPGGDAGNGGAGGTTEDPLDAARPPGRDGELPPPRRRTLTSPSPGADDPANNVAFDGGERARDVNELVKEQSGASDVAPWAAAGLAAALGLGAWLTARRRRRARDA